MQCGLCFDRIIPVFEFNQGTSEIINEYFREKTDFTEVYAKNRYLKRALIIELSRNQAKDRTVSAYRNDEIRFLL